MREFPLGLDYAWLACDAAGQVAMFANAATGPIPAAVLDGRPPTDHAEALVRRLSAVGGHTLLIRFPRPDDYILWAKRGLYAYDWRESGQYELIALPTRPRVVSEFPRGRPARGFGRPARSAFRHLLGAV